MNEYLAYLAKVYRDFKVQNDLDDLEGLDAAAPPEGLNPDSPWVEYTADDGRFYYVHDETEATQWVMPEEGISGRHESSDEEEEEESSEDGGGAEEAAEPEAGHHHGSPERS